MIYVRSIAHFYICQADGADLLVYTSERCSGQSFPSLHVGQKPKSSLSFFEKNEPCQFAKPRTIRRCCVWVP